MLAALAVAPAVGSCATRCPTETSCVSGTDVLADGRAARREAVLRAAVAPDSCERRRVLEEALADTDPQTRLLAALVLIGDEPLAPATGADRGGRAAGLELPPEPEARTPNPRVVRDRPLTRAERIVRDDPWFAGTLFLAAWSGSGSADERVRAIGVRALGRLRRDEPPVSAGESAR